jgi:hypothetical protein
MGEEDTTEEGTEEAEVSEEPEPEEDNTAVKTIKELETIVE